MIVPHPNLSANAIPRSGSTCAQCENTIDPRRSRRAAGQFVFSPRLLWSGRIHSRAESRRRLSSILWTLLGSGHGPKVFDRRSAGKPLSRCDEGGRNGDSTDVRLDVRERLEPVHGSVAVPKLSSGVGRNHAWG
jgi:hypothetical protein